jgi:hypothetical protein
MKSAARLPVSILLVVLLSAPCFAWAHGLLLDAENHGETIAGTVYYSNGELAVREAVELLDLSTPDATPVAGETDGAGKFSFPVSAKHRYRISAYGAEGHGVDVEIEAVTGAQPKLIDTAAAQERSWLLPAWAVIGAILLASMVPAVISRRRSTASAVDIPGDAATGHPVLLMSSATERSAPTLPTTPSRSHPTALANRHEARDFRPTSPSARWAKPSA